MSYVTEGISVFVSAGIQLCNVNGRKESRENLLDAVKHAEDGSWQMKWLSVINVWYDWTV